MSSTHTEAYRLIPASWCSRYSCPTRKNGSSLHDIIDHTFFTHSVVPGYIPISTWDMPPDFQHLSSLISL
ncbi:hypothetical protein EDB86DRAFT_2941786, partial [Lactarius hatsudake]